MPSPVERLPEEEPAEVVSLSVREGELVDAGSWIYAWVRLGGDRRVVCAGSTGLHPAARAWLHLHDPDPGVGRVRALFPEAASEPLDVLALRLPPHVDRAAARAALIVRLREAGLLSERYVGDPPGTPADAGVDAECVAQAELLVARVAAHAS